MSDRRRAQRIAAVTSLLGATAAVAATVALGLGAGSERRGAVSASLAGVGDAPARPSGSELSPGDPVLGDRRRARARAFPPARNLRAARAYARDRAGVVTWAVVDTRGRLSGMRSRTDFPTASVVKAMLLVAYLDRPGRRERRLEPGERGLLEPMITRSDNGAATRVHAEVGDAGLWRVARRARMQRFRVWGYWASAHTNAADQARFFRRVNSLTPKRHRRYARRLLAGIVTTQRWGVPRAARRWRPYFKGGWRGTVNGRLVHQAALLERGGRRLSLAVLTDGNPSHEYGAESIRGVAARLMREPRRR